MRRLKWLLPLLLLTLPVPAMASDEETLTAMLHEFLWGASVGSKSAHENFWADELIYTSSSGTRTGKEQILRSMENAEEPAEDAEPAVVYTAEDIEIKIFEDTAIVAFRLLGTEQGGSGMVREYLNTGTFLRRDDEWRVIAWQATRIPAGQNEPQNED